MTSAVDPRKLKDLMKDSQTSIPEADDDEEADDEPEEKPDDLETRVEKILERTLPKFLQRGNKEPKDGPAKRPTYRDEEESMFERVEAKVDVLLKAEKTSKENHPEPGESKAEPEPVPAMPRKRRVESILGW